MLTLNLFQNLLPGSSSPSERDPGSAQRYQSASPHQVLFSHLPTHSQLQVLHLFLMFIFITFFNALNSYVYLTITVATLAIHALQNKAHSIPKKLKNNPPFQFKIKSLDTLRTGLNIQGIQVPLEPKVLTLFQNKVLRSLSN